MFGSIQLENSLGRSDGYAARLSKLIVIGAVVGTLVIGLLVTVVAGLPFYQSLKRQQDEGFSFELASIEKSLDQYLVRISEVATQVTSRTKAREELERYNAGLISVDSLQSFSEPILGDALSLKDSLIGITRFDEGGSAVVNVGVSLSIDRNQLSLAAGEPAGLIGPFTIEQTDVIAVVAPIVDREGRSVGTDVVAFDFGELLAVLQEYASIDRSRDIYLMRIDDGQAELLYSSLENEIGRELGMELAALAAFSSGSSEASEASIVSTEGFFGSDGVLGYQLYRDLGWIVALRSDTQALYGAAYRAIARYFLVLIVLVVVASLAVFYLLWPLAGKVVSLTKDLHAQIDERRAVEKALGKRVTQQEAVADFGQFCLTSKRIDELLDRAVMVTAEMLQVEFCKVLELIPGRNVLLLRSGVGWNDGIVGTAEVELESESQAKYTLQSHEAVSVEDLTLETRFHGPALLTDHGVRSGVSVIIDPLNPWGILGVHSRQRRVFDKNDTNFVQAMANCLAEAIERINAEEFSRASEARFRALYHDNPAVFITVGSDLRVQSINHYGAMQLGYSAEEMVGKPVQQNCHKEDERLLVENIQKCITSSEQIHRWELRKIRRDGSIMWVRETARMVTDPNGEKNVLIVCEDVSEARLLSDRLSYEASHDPLTGLFNRREFEARLNRLIVDARQGEIEHVLCFIDLDQFKVINDTCGHVAGDQLLCQLGELVRKSLRKVDTVARLGGDEFGLLLEHCSMKQAEVIARELHAKCEEYRFAWDRRSFRVGISMGLVSIAQSSGSITDVMRNADSACYSAKDAGRNRVHVYQADDADVSRHQGEMKWVATINEALEENRFLLYAQPIKSINAAQDDEIHHELLIRMQGRDKKVIPPGAFLPAAERYNLAVRIDKWVVRTLIEYLQKYPNLLEELGVCSINLSGQSLADSEFLSYILTWLQKSGIDTNKICFEITETAAIANMTTALKFMEEVRKFGCRFSLDDFGSGFSSFAYLKGLPVDYLKIDGVFVKDIVNSSADFAMVKSIHEIGKALGKTTVAEFVESEEIRHALTMIGVDYAQGFAIGRPVPLYEFSSISAFFVNDLSC